MYVKRTIERNLLELFSSFPAIAILGLRQVVDNYNSRQVLAEANR